MGRFGDRIKERKSRNRGFRLDWRLPLINTLFWFACLGASGFNVRFMWFAMLFIAIPWIFVGRRKSNVNSNVIEFGQSETAQIAQKPNNIALPAPKEIHEKILEDAEIYIEKIKAAANGSSGQLGENLRSMVVSLENVQNGLLKQPENISNVQRLFTYYAPEAANLLVARGKAANIGDNMRLDEIDTMFSKLEIAFKQFSNRLNGNDTRAVEIDLKLLAQSLDQDFGKIEN